MIADAVAVLPVLFSVSSPSLRQDAHTFQQQDKCQHGSCCGAHTNIDVHSVIELGVKSYMSTCGIGGVIGHGGDASHGVFRSAGVIKDIQLAVNLIFKGYDIIVPIG